MMTIGIGANSGTTSEAITDAIVHTEQLAGQRADAIASLEGTRFLEPLHQAAERSAKPVRLLALTDVRRRSADC